MSISRGNKLNLPVNGDQGDEHYEELMRMWRALDVLIMPNVLDNTQYAPPTRNNSDGDFWIVPPGATGAWQYNDNLLARWSSVKAGWEFYTPLNGWMVFVASKRSFYRYYGGVWSPFLPGDYAPIPRTASEASGSNVLIVGDEINGIGMDGDVPQNLIIPDGNNILIPVGSSVNIIQRGTGAVTIIGETSVTIHTRSPVTSTLAGQWAQAVATKMSDNVWVLSGDLA